jgi:hypothetical protein
MLGERMIEDRKGDHYASVRFDKLFINDSIYKSADQTDQIVYSRRATVLLLFINMLENACLRNFVFIRLNRRGGTNHVMS